MVALARAGIVLDLLLHHRRQQKDGARAMQRVAGVLHRRIGGGTEGAGRYLSACLPVAAQLHQESQIGSAVLSSRLVESAEVLRSLHQQLRQWVAMNTSIADELAAHKSLSLQKRLLADAEAQLADKVDQLLRRLPQPGSDISVVRHQLAAGGVTDQVWSALGARATVACAAQLSSNLYLAMRVINRSSEAKQREVLAATLRPVDSIRAKATISSEVGQSSVGNGRLVAAKHTLGLYEQPSSGEGACAPVSVRGRKRCVDTALLSLLSLHSPGSLLGSSSKARKWVEMELVAFVLVAAAARTVCSKVCRQHEDSGLVYICRVRSRQPHQRRHRHLVYRARQQRMPLQLH